MRGGPFQLGTLRLQLIGDALVERRFMPSILLWEQHIVVNKCTSTLCFVE